MNVPSTQRLIVVCFIITAGVMFGLALAYFINLPNQPIYQEPVVPLQRSELHRASDFKAALTPLLQTRFGTTTIGFEPARLIYVYPGLAYSDFNNVEAVIGKYEYRDGFLWYTNNEVMDATADDLTNHSFLTLYRNLKQRLNFPDNLTVHEVIALIEKKEPEPSSDTTTPPVNDNEEPDNPVACTEEAKVCPDGSAVGRTGPNCEFAACPIVTTPPTKEMTCAPEQREAEACIEIYQPVCGSVQVQCVTTPCNPVPETFPNSCFACANDNVISYTDGECAL